MDASASRVLILNFPFPGTHTHPFLDCMRDWSNQVQRRDPNQAAGGRHCRMGGRLAPSRALGLPSGFGFPRAAQAESPNPVNTPLPLAFRETFQKRLVE